MENMSDIKKLEEEVNYLSKKVLELNKRLVDSEQTKSRFLSLVTNELNNPMTVLVGMVPHLKLLVCEKNEKIYPMLNQEVLNLDLKIKNLVMTASVESGELDISNVLVAPIDIVNDVVESLRYVVEERKIHLHVNNLLDEKVVVDPQVLSLIARNLISNASLYCLVGSAVEVTIEKKNNIFSISVKNYGEPPHFKYKPEMFMRFSDGPQGQHGLGLGLSVVRALCERFEGSVDYTLEDNAVIFVATLVLDETVVNSQAYGANEFLFESFDDTIEL